MSSVCSSSTANSTFPGLGFEPQIPGNVSRNLGFEPQSWKRGICSGTGTHARHAVKPRCRGRQGKCPVIAYCFTQCSNGCSLGSLLFPRQDNHVQRCMLRQNTPRKPCLLRGVWSKFKCELQDGCAGNKLLHSNLFSLTLLTQTHLASSFTITSARNRLRRFHESVIWHH